MKGRSLQFVGLGLLAIAFVFAAARIAFRASGRSAGSGDKITIRFAHWNLHGGLREAYEEAIANYERLHPKIIVEQMPVPVRVWPTWQRTQLIGGTAPDIIQLGRGTNDEVISRYFRPLTTQAMEPNPYNVGTPLAGERWRDTFVDGLTGDNVYYPDLQEIYGVPTLQMNMRAFYNRDLLEKISGNAVPPQNYAEFSALMAKSDAWAKKQGGVFVPIAGSGDYATHLFQRLMQSQTQAELYANDTDLTRNGTLLMMGPAVLRGGWGLRSPGMQRILTIFQSVGREMSPGFFQLKRDDSLLAFAQQSSLVILSGSWDYSLLKNECTFPVLVAPLPLPEKNDPRFGRELLGVPPETQSSLDAIYGVTLSSAHADIAIDFLRYLTSRKVGARFAATSQRLPATIGLDLPEELRPFSLRTEGPVPGLSFSINDSSPDFVRWLQTNAYRLFEPGATISDFTTKTELSFREAFASDLRRLQDVQLRTSQREDSTLVAQLMAGPAKDDLAAKVVTTQVMREMELYRLDTALKK
jgi:raffinose/stachyose/melibiose transport system substrate-binding protein